ncbi:MAG: 30S ribosomal protein S17 [Candidatus Methanoliparum thermophilum]|uniref:Small ribosomal subunit protein uS17 n=1 Tax=Methanoliparum thermophilum TaxID=2491083 RepID=A0A520KTW1_METT2|nr:30S ribosomal protein S17 [Candidatus Methanoliparum sp. LAM-1]RZN65519.1 MAG: 30S ribosomal protein S17 [Candidatus Methanoliparum thermophilum]BDC35386.1 30S ribosomal protein S17 [Candidatus Methanoliparum sp. LAM-1]
MSAIGYNVPIPEEECKDQNCPFHGILSIRGQVFVGKAVSQSDKTIVVKRERNHYVKKYKRYERRTSKIHAHNPPCIKVNKGDTVRIAECRPISKTVSFVVIEKL